MEGFTPFAGLSGGVLIGLAAVMLLALTGRIAGVSGILSNAIHAGSGSAERWLFLAGLVAGALLHQWLTGVQLPVRTLDWPYLVGGGLLVGFGTRLGGGCTSGHGVCGIARFSPRSIVATVTFMTCGIVTVFITRHLLGWPT
ncbi:MAG: YeeE/YedE thiosulfate transporter family protein [Gammaproteobacteria bacterium]|nr:YeeE/YedE thiosulfate transporter family protein [Gammaproteobacteria bacterium]